MRTLVRRWHCHRSLTCCQRIDKPMCNSAHDPHRTGRLHYRYGQWRAMREESA